MIYEPNGLLIGDEMAGEAMDYLKSLSPEMEAYIKAPDDSADLGLEKEQYAHAPGDNTSDWQLPIHTAEHVQKAVNAIVTGAHTIPDEAMPAAVTKIGHAIVNLSPTQDKAPLLSKLHTGTPFDGATELITSDKEEPGAVVTGSPTMAANPTAHTGGTVNTGAMHPLNQRGPLSGVNTASMKSLGARRVGGYAVRWGSPKARDLQGEYFTPSTYLGLDSPVKVRPMLYHHGQDPKVGDEVIGVWDTFKPDNVGLWIEGELSKSSRYAAAVEQLASRGALGLSSGTMPHLHRKSADGEIQRWLILEVSATPTPAEPRNTQLSLKSIQSAYNVLNIPFDPQVPSLADMLAQGDSEDMSVDNLKTAIREVMSEDGTKSLPGRSRLPAPAAAPTNQNRIDVLRGTQYGDLSASDMSFMYEILRYSDPRYSKSATPWQPTVEFMRELADKQIRDVRAGKLPKSSLKGLDDSGFLKAQELDNTGQTGFGLEWAPDSWRGELWLRVRQENVVAPNLQMIEMPTNPYELPIESTDPTVYFVPETTDQTQLVLTGANPIPQSKAATGKVQLKATKLALRMAWSTELNEDVLIPIVANYRRQAIRAMQNAIDSVALNGDTNAGASVNVNLIDATPSATAKYLALNGFRKYCLVTNAAQSTSAGGPVTLPLLRKARFLLNGAYALRPRDLAWFVDDSTYAKLLSLPEFITADKFPESTNQTGLLGRLDGIDVFPTAELGLSQTADGKVSNTGSNNTKGTAILVFRPLWFLGYRREVTAFIERIDWADIYHLTVTARIALAPQDTQSAALLYNITV